MDKWKLSKNKFSIISQDSEGRVFIIARASCNKSDRDLFGKWLKDAEQICNLHNCYLEIKEEVDDILLII